MYKSATANLMVDNVRETVQFYQEGLGFTEVAAVPDERGGLQFAIVSKDQLELMFQSKESLMAEYPIIQADKLQPSITLYIRVDGFDQLYQEVKANHQLIADIHTTFYGSREFAIADNNGYVLTFAESLE